MVNDRQSFLKLDGTPTGQASKFSAQGRGKTKMALLSHSTVLCLGKARSPSPGGWDQLLGKQRCPGDASGRKLGLFSGLG